MNAMKNPLKATRKMQYHKSNKPNARTAIKPKENTISQQRVENVLKLNPYVHVIQAPQIASLRNMCFATFRHVSQAHHSTAVFAGLT